MFGQMTSLLVVDETFAVVDMFGFVSRREIYFVDVHGIGVPGRVSIFHCLGRQNIAVAPSSEFPESYHVLVKLSCFIESLLPFPLSLCLSIRESSSSYHDSKLVSYPLLEGINQNAVKVASAACLSQPEGSGILVKVTI